jgi:hypothetical protein
LSSNPYEGTVGHPSMSGSHYSNYVSGISGYDASRMEQNGWKFHDRSRRDVVVWQFVRTLENGRHDEIRLNHHEDYAERNHYHVKIMINGKERPTKEQFVREIAPKINRSMKRVLKREGSVEVSNAFGIAVSHGMKMMTICAGCGSRVEVTTHKTCTVCGKSLS